MEVPRLRLNRFAREWVEQGPGRWVKETVKGTMLDPETQRVVEVDMEVDVPAVSHNPETVAGLIHRQHEEYQRLRQERNSGRDVADDSSDRLSDADLEEEERSEVSEDPEPSGQLEIPTLGAVSDSASEGFLLTEAVVMPAWLPEPEANPDRNAAYSETERG